MESVFFRKEKSTNPEAARVGVWSVVVFGCANIGRISVGYGAAVDTGLSGAFLPSCQHCYRTMDAEGKAHPRASLFDRFY